MVFFSALLSVSFSYENTGTIDAFSMRPPFSTLTSRSSPLRTAESILFFMRSFFFPNNTRIRTNEHQAHERTVHLLDHKVTVTRWCYFQRFSPSPFIHEYTINAFFDGYPYSFSFSMRPGLAPTHTKQKRTVYPPDHKATVTLWSS